MYYNFIIYGAILICSFFSNSLFAQVKSSPTYIISNISVVPITTDTIMDYQTVVITNNVITYIGEDVIRPTKEAILINGTGKFLMPALGDVHTHLPKENFQSFFALNLINGITKIRSMRGTQEHLLLKKDISEGKYAAPSIKYGSPTIHKKSIIDSSNIDSFSDSFKEFDFITIMSVKDSAMFDQITKAVKNIDKSLSGYKPKQISLQYALESNNYSSIIRLGGYLQSLKQGNDYFKKMVSLTIDKGVYNYPSLMWNYINTLGDSTLNGMRGIEYVDPETVLDWKNKRVEYIKITQPATVEKHKESLRKFVAFQQKVMKSMHNSGAKFLISPDAGSDYLIPGFSMLEEMKRYQDAGLSNYTILKTATYNVAEFYNELNNFGTIEKDKIADIIILDGNPIEDINNLGKISSIFLNGKLYNKEELIDLIK